MQNNQDWHKKEIKKIQNIAQVSNEEAQEILKQRILDFAQKHNITEEEAKQQYCNIRQNTVSIKLP